MHLMGDSFVKKFVILTLSGEIAAVKIDAS
jgi:hypothetical protein